MATCSRCNAPNADLFTVTGDVVCRFCFNSAQNAQADARARASLERDAPMGMKAADPGAPPATPGKVIGSGLALMGVAVAFAVGTMVVFDRVYPILTGGLLVAGFANLARGLALRRR